MQPLRKFDCHITSAKQIDENCKPEVLRGGLGIACATLSASVIRAIRMPGLQLLQNCDYLLVPSYVMNDRTKSVSVLGELCFDG